jgi:hypothetical protein
MEAAAEEEAAS